MEPLHYTDVILLGAVQGLTEFLPVSSSGHLAVGQAMLGVRGPGLTLSIVMHGGTLAAVVLFYARDLGRLSTSVLRSVRKKSLSEEPAARLALLVVLASVPTAAIGVALKSTIETALADVTWAGVGFLVTALVLLVARRAPGFGLKARGESDFGVRDALLVGTVQGIAVVPGISRSGSTISTALLLGIAPVDAARFSFLLAIPAIAGALVLELRHGPPAGTVPGPLIVGAAVSFVTGFVALKVLVGLLARGRFAEFSYYLVPLGVATITWGLLK